MSILLRNIYNKFLNEIAPFGKLYKKVKKFFIINLPYMDIDKVAPISQVAEVKTIQVEKITATPLGIEETHKTVTTIIEKNTENTNEIQNKIPENPKNENINKKVDEVVEEIRVNEDENTKDSEKNKNIEKKQNEDIQEIKEVPNNINLMPQSTIVNSSKEEIKNNTQENNIIQSEIKDDEPVFKTVINKEKPIEIHDDTSELVKEVPEPTKQKGMSKDRVIPVGIVETKKTKEMIIESPVEVVEDQPMKVNIKENLQEKLIPLELLNPTNVDKKEIKEKMLPLEIKEKKIQNNNTNKMEIEEIHANITIPQKEVQKEMPLKANNNPKLISLDIIKETKKEIKENIIPLNIKEAPRPITNIITKEISKEPLKEKEICLQSKEHPREKVISLDIKEIIKHSEIPLKIKEAYNKMLEHPKKKQENELITEILEGKKIDKKDIQERIEKPEKNKREKKDNRNVNNIINQILRDKTVYPTKPMENININPVNINNNRMMNNNNFVREDRRDKRINRNEQILDILQGKLINIPPDNNVETIYEDRNDNIFKKKIGSNLQRLFDRKVVNNNNFNNNTNNYNNPMNLIENNNRYLNIPGNYPNPEPPRMNYPRNYQNIQSMLEINKQPETQIDKNGNILLEKMDKVEIIEEKEENKFPKNLQITEYPRIPQRMVRKEQKRTEINLIDPSKPNDEIHIMDTVNRNINLFPHIQNIPNQNMVSIPQSTIPNLEVQKTNEEKMKKKDEYDFLKQFGKQKDDNSKELLDLIQTVIEEDPNQIKMFQQKIKDDEIKSGKKIDMPIEEEEDEADMQAIENYKKRVQFNNAEFRKNRKPPNINKLMGINPGNGKKKITMAEKRMNLMKDVAALNQANQGVIELVDNQPQRGNGRGRRRRGPEKRNDDEEYKVEDDGNMQNDEDDLNNMENMKEEAKNLKNENDNKTKQRTSIKSMLTGLPTEEEMELVNNIQRGRRNKKRNTNKIQPGENVVVTLDDNDDDEIENETEKVNEDNNNNINNNNTNNIVTIRNEKKGRKKKGRKKPKNEIMEINLGDSDVGAATNEETNEVLESNTNTNINNLGEVNEINEISDDGNTNNKDETLVKNNLNLNTGITNIGLGLDNTKDIPIYNPSAAFSNNTIANNIASIDTTKNNIPTQVLSPIASMPSLPGVNQKDFISSLLSTLIKYYGYETLVSCVIHRQKSNNEKLDEFVDFLLKNNTYSDVISCLINCKNEQDNMQTELSKKNTINTTPMKAKKLVVQLNKENNMDLSNLNNNISTSSLLNKKKAKDEDIEVIGLDDNIPPRKRKKNARWGNKPRGQKINKNFNDNNVINLEEDDLRINLDENSGNNNIDKTSEKMIDITPTTLGDHYHKGKDGLIFRYIFNNMQNDNMAVYKCCEQNCKSKAVMKLREQEFYILNEHSNYYLHKDMINSLINDKNVKLMQRKGFQDVQISADNRKEVEWSK